MTPKQKRNKKKRLIAKYGYHCCWCGNRFPSEELTLEHLQPSSRGGSNSLENLRLACFSCNNSRGNSLFFRPLREQSNSVVQENIVVGSNRDSKSKFQEFIQANGVMRPPKYLTQKTGGTDHQPEFTSKVYVKDRLYGVGKGGSKKEAEKKAADNALAKLEKSAFF